MSQPNASSSTASGSNARAPLPVDPTPVAPNAASSSTANSSTASGSNARAPLPGSPDDAAQRHWVWDYRYRYLEEMDEEEEEARLFEEVEAGLSELVEEIETMVPQANGQQPIEGDLRNLCRALSMAALIIEEFKNPFWQTPRSRNSFWRQHKYEKSCAAKNAVKDLQELVRRMAQDQRSRKVRWVREMDVEACAQWFANFRWTYRELCRVTVSMEELEEFCMSQTAEWC